MKIRDIIEGKHHDRRILSPLEVVVPNSNISFPWPLSNPHENSTSEFINNAVKGNHQIFSVYSDSNRGHLLTPIKMLDETMNRWRVVSHLIGFTKTNINILDNLPGNEDLNLRNAIESVCVKTMEKISGELDGMLDEILTHWDRRREGLIETTNYEF